MFAVDIRSDEIHWESSCKNLEPRKSSSPAKQYSVKRIFVSSLKKRTCSRNSRVRSKGSLLGNEARERARERCHRWTFNFSETAFPWPSQRGEFFEIAKQRVRKFHGMRGNFRWMTVAGSEEGGMAPWPWKLELSILVRISLWRGRGKRKNNSTPTLCISRTYVRSFHPRFLQSANGTREREELARDFEIDVPSELGNRAGTRKAGGKKARRGRKKMHKRGAKRPGWWSRRLYFISYAWNFWIPRVAFIAPRESIRVSVEAYILYG